MPVQLALMNSSGRLLKDVEADSTVQLCKPAPAAAPTHLTQPQTHPHTHTHKTQHEHTHPQTHLFTYLLHDARTPLAKSNFSRFASMSPS